MGVISRGIAGVWGGRAGADDDGAGGAERAGHPAALRPAAAAEPGVGAGRGPVVSGRGRGGRKRPGEAPGGDPHQRLEGLRRAGARAASATTGCITRRTSSLGAAGTSTASSRSGAAPRRGWPASAASARTSFTSIARKRTGAGTTAVKTSTELLLNETRRHPLSQARPIAL